jgi:hypothetical protein
MQAIAAELGLKWQLVPYKGSNFNGIFEKLARGIYDCVTSGKLFHILNNEICDPKLSMR